MPRPIRKKEPNTVLGLKLENIIPQWTQRVFVDTPRLFSFSARSCNSTRHPHIALLVDLSLSSRRDPSEELLRLIHDSPDIAFIAEKKWKVVGEIHDSKVCELRFVELRQPVVSSTAIRKKLECLWASRGCTPERGLDFDTYSNIWMGLNQDVIPASVNSVALQQMFQKNILSDWSIDSQGGSYVSFAHFALSMLELADNWVKSVEAEDYEEWISKILSRHILKRCNSAIQERQNWEDICAFLKRNAEQFIAPPLVQIRVTSHGRINYERIP